MLRMIKTTFSRLVMWSQTHKGNMEKEYIGNDGTCFQAYA